MKFPLLLSLALLGLGTVAMAQDCTGMWKSTLTINPTGILQATGTFSSARVVTLGGTGGASSGGTFDVTAANNETRTGVISGTPTAAGSFTTLRSPFLRSSLIPVNGSAVGPRGRFNFSKSVMICAKAKMPPPTIMLIGA